MLSDFWMQHEMVTVLKFLLVENKLFSNTGCSLVIAPYQNANQSIIGAIGVLGPRHMNYARIIPMVDYTSKAIDRALGH